MYQQDAQVAAAGDDSQIDPTDVGGNLRQFAQNAPLDIQGLPDPSDPRALVQGSQQAVQQHTWDQHQARGRLLDLDRGSIGMGGPSPRCRASWAWGREETGEEVARGPAAR